MTEPLTPDMLARLETFLDAIEDRLRAADVSRDRRRAVADDLETQIRDSLAGLGRPPGPDDLDAVLAGIDPPEAYGDAPAAAAAPTLIAASSPPRPLATVSRLCPTVWWGVAGLVLTMCGAIPMLGLRFGFVALARRGSVRIENMPTGHDVAGLTPAKWLEVALLGYFGALGLCAIGLIVMTIFGWSAARQIGRSRGAFHGLGWAAVEALPVPTALAYAAGMTLGALLMNAYAGNTGYTDVKQSVAMLIAAVVGTAGTAAIVWLFVRVGRGA